MTDINRQRLLEVVKGNFELYLNRRATGNYVYDEVNWGLLRHDIHVLLHASSPTTEPK